MTRYVDSNAIHLPTSCYRRRQDHPGCINGLKDTFEMTLSRNLFDQHRCQSLRPELLVDTKVVDLTRIENAAVCQ